MLLYYLKSAFRSIKNNLKFTALNTLGFAFALSVCIAIILFVIQEYSYDRHFKDVDRIVRIVDAERNSSNVDYRVKDILMQNFPEIEDACFYFRDVTGINITINQEAYKAKDVVSVSNSFFSVFSVPFLLGDPNHAFQDERSAVITEANAKKYFGRIDVLGEKIRLFDMDTVQIAAVIKDFPAYSSITGGIFVNGENKNFKFSFSCEDGDDKSTYRYHFRVYAKLFSSIDHKDLIEKLNQKVSVFHPFLEQIHLLFLKDIYLLDSTRGSNTDKGNFELLCLLSFIAFIVLLLAIINYVNLFLAQKRKKSRIVGIRKTYGAESNHLIFHFISESVLISFLAFTIALLFLVFLEPVYQRILDEKFSLYSLFQKTLLLYFLFGIFLLGILIGLIPALKIIRIKPYEAIKGKEKIQKSISRNTLLVFQFTCSISLLICIFFVQKQINFVKHKDTGFVKEQLLCVSLPYLDKKDRKRVDYLVSELQKSSYIQTLSLSNGVPGQVFMRMGVNYGQEERGINVPTLFVDSNFINTFQLKLLKGDPSILHSRKKFCIVNQAFYQYFEFENLEGKEFPNYGNPPILGVINNFQYNSFHSKIEPACLMFGTERASFHLSIRIVPNGTDNLMQLLEEKWQEVLPDYPFTYRFFDRWFDSMYKKEERLAQTISLFAIIAILISCFGILGLSIFTTEQRTKEIGVRKTNGAKTIQIIQMLNRDFSVWVLIAFFPACGIAYYTMNQWLQNFAYRTELSWWVFALSGVITLCTALLTVSFQSWRAANKNPIESLRYE